MSLHINKIINTPIESNSYILYDKDKSDECVIVDPGSKDNVELLKEVICLALKPRFIFLTHEHYDHCWGVNGLREKYPYVELVTSKQCSEFIQNSKTNYSRYYCNPSFCIEPSDIILDDIGWCLEWNGYLIPFYSAKGHSSSGICFFIGNAIFTGDSLIKGIKTITKFQTGNKEELKETLEFFESQKGKGNVIYPGHGPCFSLDEYDIWRAF